MSTHEIHMDMPEKTVLNKDVVFDIYSDGSKLGSLKVSKGSLEWAPANFVNGFHMQWEQFDQIMQSEGTH